MSGFGTHYGAVLMDVGSFERAAREHKDRVHGYAFWMIHDREEAGDVAQEALVRLWQHRSEVPEEAARGWLLRAAHHLCIDRMRRRAIRSGPPMDDVAAKLSDGAPGPHRAAASREAGRLIFDALQSLSQRDQSAVLLREVQGLPYDEIARILDMNLGTLKATLHRARERLRDRLVQAGMTP